MTLGAAPGPVAQRIDLAEGFYDGTQLSAQLKTQLDANAEFVSNGLTPFTVAYNSISGKFSITPNASTIGFVYTNTAVPVRRNSTAGDVLGFTADAAAASPLVSDTKVPGLGDKINVLSGSASANTNVVLTDTVTMDVDSALAIDISSAAMNATYKVVYRRLN